MTATSARMDSIADLRRQFGDEAVGDLTAFLRRNYPSDAGSFIEVLYRDLDELRETMAASAKHFYESSGKPWGEDQISNHIKAVLDAKACSRVTSIHREAGSRGHVDITVEQQRLHVRWIAEAKVDDGPKYISGGLAQLHSRYASGFEGDVGLLIYCFGTKPKSSLRGWRAHLQRERLQGFMRDVDDDEFSFRSDHEHVGTENVIRTRHMIFPLYYKPEK